MSSKHELYFTWKPHWDAISKTDLLNEYAHAIIKNLGDKQDCLCIYYRRRFGEELYISSKDLYRDLTKES